MCNNRYNNFQNYKQTNNKIVKKYIEHLRSANKTLSTNTLNKGSFIEINKSKK